MHVISRNYVLIIENYFTFPFKIQAWCYKVSSSTTQKNEIFTFLIKKVLCNEVCNNTPSNVLQHRPDIATS